LCASTYRRSLCCRPPANGPLTMGLAPPPRYPPAMLGQPPDNTMSSKQDNNDDGEYFIHLAKNPPHSQMNFKTKNTIRNWLNLCFFMGTVQFYFFLVLLGNIYLSWRWMFILCGIRVGKSFSEGIWVGFVFGTCCDRSWRCFGCVRNKKGGKVARSERGRAEIKRFRARAPIDPPHRLVRSTLVDFAWYPLQNHMPRPESLELAAFQQSAHGLWLIQLQNSAALF